MAVQLSPGVRVMLRPQPTWASLAAKTPPIGIWRALRRPALVAFVLGCTMSLITFPRVTARLAIPGAFYWTFVPLAEMLALGLVSAKSRQTISFPSKVDLFFVGHLCWLLWLIGIAAIFSFLPPAHAFALTNPFWLYYAALAVIIWSAWIDFGFFRAVTGSSRAGAVGRLFLQRAISWSMILLIFSGSVVWQAPR